MLSKKDQKFIKSLKVKKYRAREDCFLIEGAKNVQELLQSDFEIEMVVGSEEFFSLNLRAGNHRNEIVKPDLLGQLSTFKTNEDVIAIARMKSWTLEDFQFDDHLFVLDGVGDPGNMGTIIRTLDWFGFNQLICSTDCAEFYHPKVINSSMGSFTRVKVMEVNLKSFYEHNELQVLSADMNGTPLKQMAIEQSKVIVMGSESHGIGEISRQHTSEFISIPRFGRAESLNVGIATGIIASHLRMDR